MAKNKAHVDRRVKEEEIVEVARRLFLDQGYEATSMTSISEGAGVAPNTLYWYYRNKDDLLVSVLDRLLEESSGRYRQIEGQPLNELVFWLLQELEQAGSLISTVHARVNQSTALKSWHDQFHKLIDQLASERLADLGIVGRESETETSILTFVVEGLLSHQCSTQKQREVIDRLTVARLG